VSTAERRVVHKATPTLSKWIEDGERIAGKAEPQAGVDRRPEPKVDDLPERSGSSGSAVLWQAFAPEKRTP
jgi:hypothetical protein